jgi:Protein of unknown function (DUF3300)
MIFAFAVAVSMAASSRLWAQGQTPPLQLYIASQAQDQDQVQQDQDQNIPTPDQSDINNPDQTDQAPYAKLNSHQLGRLVAPIALYPDALVAQVLAASEFPAQITDAETWLKQHPGLDAKTLAADVDQEPWEPSVKALVQFPSVLANMSQNLGWTSELGDAYYNQSEDVMKAVQEMRKQAQKAGNLKSTSQLNVENQNNQVVIAPANPDVVYVPAYDPWLVYGYPIAPWPYWVDVPGIWWSGPGLYFGIGFPIAPFIGFGWGWGGWGLDWGRWGVYYHHEPYFARGPAFFDRRGYYGGRGDFGRAGNFRGNPGGRNEYRGYSAPREGNGVRSGAFGGIDRGGTTRGYSARGQSSYGGGFHGGGFGGGGFHGGGGHGGGHR